VPLLAVASCGGGGSIPTTAPRNDVALTWVWMSGSSALNASAVYGTQETPSTSGAPGARTDAASWTDSGGNLWLFGGYGIDSQGNSNVLNDLWEFSRAANTWVWVRGSNKGGATGVYGTQRMPAATNEPGARDLSVSWMDAGGNLWLFGGEGFDSQGLCNLLSDLWEYSPSTNTWVWVSSPTVGGATGAYGTQGMPSSANSPGARSRAVSSIDSAGNLWLFGGTGYDSQGISNLLNDLWEYNPTAKTWTWVSASNVRNAFGVYGSKGTSAASNVPGARDLAVSWFDSAGNFWLFGGYGMDSLGGSGDLNDLWQYNPGAKSWTWTSGFDLLSTGSGYGTQGTPSANNVPGARQEAVS